MTIDTSESKKWVEDPYFEKFYRIPKIYYLDRMRKLGFDPRGKRILDFGCGSGLITDGIAAHLNPNQVVGVDVTLGVDDIENSAVANRYNFNLSSLKERVEFVTTKVEGSLGHQCFDAVLSWSVIEHIDRRSFEREINKIYECLALNGVAIIQSAPIYYSPFGSHVYAMPPWSHLYMSESEFEHELRKLEAPSRVTSLLQCKNTLNRMTSRGISRVFECSGFRILDYYATRSTLIPPDYLLDVYSSELLQDEQAVWVLSKG